MDNLEETMLDFKQIITKVQNTREFTIPEQRFLLTMLQEYYIAKKGMVDKLIDQDKDFDNFFRTNGRMPALLLSPYRAYGSVFLSLGILIVLIISMLLR